MPLIFDVHQMMLDDLDYIESIRNMIETQKVNAEFAWQRQETILLRGFPVWMTLT